MPHHDEFSLAMSLCSFAICACRAFSLASTFAGTISFRPREGSLMNYVCQRYENRTCIGK